MKCHVLRASSLALIAIAAFSRSRLTHVYAANFETKSGIRSWVDPETPDDRQTYTSSRGDSWELVMSDEFNTPNRSFRPGDDHMWTSIEKPDGVNAALEVYSHNMTSTACDDDGTCYFYIKAIDEVTTVRVWNDYQNPPGYKNVDFVRAMVQSWNKFCFQGGMAEVRVQLPGAVSNESGNPDVKNGKNARVSSLQYYPVWPGIWMMGNLGRAIFSASTARIWPFSYNECNDDVFLSSNQRISACDANPGSGMNPYQGRGAPEIDIIEGSGHEISTSMQIGPGMPSDFRIIYPTEDASAGCIYTNSCTTPGANTPDVPTAFYKAKRGHKTWYQGMRYAANNFCTPDAKLKQDYKTVKANMDKGITENSCTLATCPSSRDANADVGPIDGSTTQYWSINTNGTCFPYMNGYTGAYLCSPGNPSTLCEKTDVPQSDKIKVFEYRMDALSSNWPIHMAAYLDYLVYQLEWVIGNQGYIRWMLEGHPVFEIPASAITNPPQDAKKSNPVKIMIEEPMYMIFNAALSSTWGTKPPNPGQPCRGDGKNEETNRICDSFPMYLKVDYIRIYQDTSVNSTMAVGCDPKTHPTKQWIADNIEAYQDADNKVVDVTGKAFCRTDDDCTVEQNKTRVVTGSCVNRRCKCKGASWTGPRCTSAMSANDGGSSSSVRSSYGPPWFAALATAAVTIAVTFLSVYLNLQGEKKQEALRKQKAVMAGKPPSGAPAPSRDSSISEIVLKNSNENYSTNFV
uniref:GH16 domain-containing protein n=1 Tax=Globisporangium ultimum (strain ATCC 200006 / CBS 805.95 / DAOM BR144) TaxID=431595 RepID=K3X0C5_GLOUD